METMELMAKQNGEAPVMQEVGAVSAAAREQHEIQAAIICAKKFPRNEASAFTKALKSFERISMAEASQYAFPRGGATVKGPSVNCARELARCWQNVRYGLRIVSVDDESIHIKGWALDLEANNYTEHEDKFKKQVQRKIDGRATWVKTTDERDLRELINRRGAIAVRNAILEILPPDLIEDVCRMADATLKTRASGELKTDKEQTVKRMCYKFDKIGVSVEMIETKLGHKVDLITPDEITELNEIFNSINDGNTQRQEHFEIPANNQAAAGIDAANEKLKQDLAKKSGK